MLNGSYDVKYTNFWGGIDENVRNEDEYNNFAHHPFAIVRFTF